MGLFRKKRREVIRQPHITDDNDAYAFRRSRTMTGSSSDAVRTVAETHADLQSDRLKHHTLKGKRRRILLYLSATTVVIGAIVTLLNNFMLSANIQSISGVPSSVLTVYERAVNTYLSSHPNERFSLSLRADALSRAVQKQFPEVSSVKLTVKPWLQPASALIVLRSPIASWTIGTTKYYIDEHGAAFQHNYSVEPALHVEDKTGIDPTSAGAVASARMIHFIGRLVSLLGTSGYGVEKIELPPNTSREVDVRLPARGYVIKTNLDRDPAGQVADIVSAVKFLDAKGLHPIYADVRVESRLYYK